MHLSDLLTSDAEAHTGASTHTLYGRGAPERNLNAYVVQEPDILLCSFCRRRVLQQNNAATLLRNLFVPRPAWSPFAEIACCSRPGRRKIRARRRAEVVKNSHRQ